MKSKNIFHTNYLGDLATHYLNPGQSLSDPQLKQMHNKIIEINNGSKNKISHKLLDEGLSISDLKERFASCIVGIIETDKIPAAFLISPIIKSEGITIVHAGLVISRYNHGTNLLALLSAGSAKIVSKRLGKVFVTNITSTPSIVENFARFSVKPWPDPDAMLIKSPKKYKKIANLLFEKYVKQYFPEPEAVVLDTKRFVLRSNSENMGFNTNLRELSKSADFKYCNFCYMWLDYEAEEDLLQVGVFNRYVALRVRFQVFVYLFLRRFQDLLQKPKATTPSLTPPSTNTVAHSTDNRMAS